MPFHYVIRPAAAWFAVLLSLTSSARSQEILYVDTDAPGANNGSSWSDAFTSLQDALGAAAGSGGTVNEIRVAQGIYKPDQGANQTPGDHTATFQLLNGVGLYGGYAGYGEPDPNARDITAFETTLSGDLAGNDQPDFLNYEDNAHHLVTAGGTDPTAVLDGFTIAAGNATAALPLGDGGGLYNDGGSPTLTNCTFHRNMGWHGGALYSTGDPTLTGCSFRENRALYLGGGMHNDGGSPTLTACAFEGNRAYGFDGAGMFTEGGNPTFVDCTFDANIGRGLSNRHGAPTLIDCTFTGHNGAGMSSDGGNPVLTGCVFSRNRNGGLRVDRGSPTLMNCMFSENGITGRGSGSGMHIGAGSSPRLTDCTFIGNHANGNSSGGGINSSGNPTLTNCTFVRNATKRYGGGMFNTHGNPTLIDCTFVGNVCGYSGGGLLTNDFTATITNCTFTDNVSENSGGGIICFSGSPTIVGCLFRDNRAQTGGGGVSVSFSSSPTLARCTFIGNTTEADGGGMHNSGGNPTLTDCVFIRNSAAGDGGGLYMPADTLPPFGTTLIHCTFFGNQANDGHGGGVFNADVAATFSNSIFWANRDITGVGESAQIHQTFELPVVNYSCIQGFSGALGGTGNIGDDPLFVDPAAGDFHLSADSPCIDAGDPAYVPEPGRTDFDGEMRLWDGDGNGVAVVDMGADEFGSFRFGDLNCDGAFNGADIDVFFLGLGDPAAYAATFPDCDIRLADMNADGAVNGADIDAFFTALGGGVDRNSTT